MSEERKIAGVSLVVGDYDEAVRFYTERLGFARDYARMKEKGVRFLEAPRDESYGNKWDLIERR